MALNVALGVPGAGNVAAAPSQLQVSALATLALISH